MEKYKNIIFDDIHMMSPEEGSESVPEYLEKTKGIKAAIKGLKAEAERLNKLNAMLTDSTERLEENLEDNK